jgi:hypothetical protein
VNREVPARFWERPEVKVLRATRLLLIIPFWQLFSKAGYSGWWSLLMVVPLVNFVALYVLAFSSWPALKK